MKKYIFIVSVIAIFAVIGTMYISKSIEPEIPKTDLTTIVDKSKLEDSEIEQNTPVYDISEASPEEEIINIEQKKNILKEEKKIQSNSNTVINNNTETEEEMAETTGENANSPIIENEIDIEESYNENVIAFMRSDDQNGVLVDIVYTNPIESGDIQQENYVFDVVFTTHSYDISEKELNKKLVIKINDINIDSPETINWVPDGIPEGHHVSGKIIIPKQLNDEDLSNFKVKSIEIKMNNVAGAELRSFKW